MTKHNPTPQEITELYKILLEQENSNHTVFITVLLGFTVVLLTATWFFNRYGIKKMVKNEMQKLFEDEFPKILEELNTNSKKSIAEEVSRYGKSVKSINGDVSRAMAISARDKGMYNYAIYWLSKFLNENLDLENQNFIRLGIDTMMEYCDELKQQEQNESSPELEGGARITLYKAEEVLMVVERIPDLMKKEKNTLKEFIQSRM